MHGAAKPDDASRKIGLGLGRVNDGGRVARRVGAGDAERLPPGGQGAGGSPASRSGAPIPERGRLEFEGSGSVAVGRGRWLSASRMGAVALPDGIGQIHTVALATAGASGPT